MSTTTYLELGTPVVVADTLTRVTDYRAVPIRPGEPGQQRRVKEWVRAHRHMTWTKPEPVRGIVVGVRHLSNGWTSSEEYGEEFTRTDGVTAYLIATALHRAPVLALLEDVTPLEQPRPAVQLADGTDVPAEAVDALEQLDGRWPGATLPQARPAVAAAVLAATGRGNHAE